VEQKTKSIMRIAFTGPESCGKSTLAQWVSETYNLPLSEEFAREYLAQKESYVQQDLDTITSGQLADWHKKGAKLVADTEMTVLKIWSEYRYKNTSHLILEAHKNQVFDHYFLCAPDIPWEADPLRENPSNRAELFLMYEAELIHLQRPFTILKGSLEKRQKEVNSILLDLLNC
jgi:nicotinamide riboside kinase